MKFTLHRRQKIRASVALQYGLVETWIGPTFYEKFDWFSIPDWSHGRVNYTDRETSRTLNLTYASSDTFILRGDYKSVLSPTGPGRNSVRIRSKRKFSTHVAVFDVRHMPEGCGTWPAIWETEESGWPSGGELDIVEGINNQGPNLVSVHTSPNCTMPREGRDMSGAPVSLTCHGGGCNVRMPSQNSFGPAFNSNGGGWFAVERRPSFIKVWFWPRRGADGSSPPSNLPADIRTTTSNRVNTDNWRRPAALFNSAAGSCDLESKFKPNNIIINLNFCGDWAGPQYPASGCPGTCVDFVNKNSNYFGDAYFDIASIRVYIS
ncbi:glycosyl hydrolase family 16, variant 2 [Coprinopsis cinerea AmutBmut pab1-1]|nr:glycosyl hydrolase family 16, variant 2 [Coprinopsis cinerea AmutBmut pab1-1]